MAIEVYRIDDRLIHGQVVVGWAQPLELEFIVLVDDEVAASAWEQDLYRMGVPFEMRVFFESVESALTRLPEYQQMTQPGLLLTGDTETMRALVERGAAIPRVNIGGVHHRAERVPRLRYVFLTPEEEADLLAILARGVEVTAQDLPAATLVPLADVLSGHGE